MRIKNVKLEWYAIRWEFNKERRERINVLSGIKEEIVKEVRKGGIKSREDLRFWLKNRLMYRYWCKAEMEVLIGGMFSEYPKEFEKIDVWEQLEPNLDRIVDYIIEEMKIW